MKNFFTIIGGMGTAATQLYVDMLNERTNAHNDQEYFDYILVNKASTPDRSSYILDHSKPNPLPGLIELIEEQSQLHPDFFVLTCNSAHYFFDQLQAATEIPILHMPRIATKAIQGKNPQAKKIGLLGTEGIIRTGVYAKVVEEAGYEPVVPTEELMNMTSRLIFDEVKEKNHVDKELYFDIINGMLGLGCDMVMLGCTEISVAQVVAPFAEDKIIDAQAELVDETIRLARKYQRGE